MNMHFNDADGRALHGLLEEASGDIVVRLDGGGFVLQASPNAAELGMDLSNLLLMPHISDFAEPDHRDAIARHVASVLHANRDMPAPQGWVEFPVHVCGSDENEGGECDTPIACRQWFALNLRPIAPDDGAPQGALGLLRSVDNTREMDDGQGQRSAPDPLKGLRNRQALIANLERCLQDSTTQAVAIVAIDKMQAILLQHGQHAADEIVWGLARFLEAMTHVDHELAQIDGERFAIRLPGMSARTAKSWVGDVLQTFAEITATSSTSDPKLTASAGVAQLETSVDYTMRQAELGLVMARAGGGKQAVVARQCVPGVMSGPLPRITPLPDEPDKRDA